MSEAIDRLNEALEGRYRIESHLGEGGMATVYLAHDVKHDRKVALKVLRPELAAVIGAERFLQEIKVTANLQHPHILPLFDSGEADTFLYYVMPYVDGESLRDKLDRERQMGVDEARIITKTFHEVFPYVTVWFAFNDIILIGTEEPLRIDLERLEARVARPEIARTCARAGSTTSTTSWPTTCSTSARSPRSAGTCR